MTKNCALTILVASVILVSIAVESNIHTNKVIYIKKNLFYATKNIFGLYVHVTYWYTNVLKRAAYVWATPVPENLIKTICIG